MYTCGCKLYEGLDFGRKRLVQGNLVHPYLIQLYHPYLIQLYHPYLIQLYHPYLIQLYHPYLIQIHFISSTSSLSNTTYII